MQKRRAFLLVELIGTTAIILLAASIAWYAITQYAVVREEIDLRRSVRLAAQAEIARLLAFAPGTTSSLGADVSLSVTTTPGQGAWSGLERVAVRATGQTRRGRSIQIELAVFRVPMRGAQ